MRVVRELDPIAWRRFVDEHPEGNVFHTPEMFEVFSRAKGHQPMLWAAVDSGDDILALLLPVNVFLFDGLLRSLTTRAIAYGSVLCAPGARGHEGLTELLRTYKRHAGGAPLFTEFRNLTDPTTTQPVLDQCGFAHEDHLNYLIDLRRPPEQILQGISSRTRQIIRRGLRRGEVVIEEIADRKDLLPLYAVLRQTYERTRVPLADISLFEAAFDVLHAKGMVRFALARVGDAPAAVSVELLYKGVVYGWYGGTNRALGAYQPTELLTWNILEWGASRSYAVYDFGGAGRPGESYGVRDFKAKFGGDLVSYGRDVCVHAPNRLRLSRLAFELLRRFL